MTTPFTHKTENYYGSQRKIHTVSWRGKGEVDGNEIRAWCIETYGQPGYQDVIERTRWLDDINENGEIFLCNDEDLTLFLLRWD
jgi:hypothetical protein